MVCDIESPIELFPGVYWVGVCDKANNLHCNPYLIVDGDEAVLIDPGSTLDFEGVYAKVTAIVPLEKIKYVVLQHQDPDLCSSTPLFESRGLKAAIVTHWRAAQLIKYYGVKSPFYSVNEHEYQLTFGNNRILHFYPTPYLHFPGAIATYDQQTKILFSSDLFGAFSHNWAFFADEVQGESEVYMEAMKAFHEHYMPGNDILRPVMERFLAIDIAMVAPQHGSIIRREVSKYIRALCDLECGSFLHPIKKELSRIDGFTGLCNQVLRRYYSTFSREEVQEVFDGTHIVLDGESGLITDYNCSGRDLWQYIFQLFYSRKGIGWLSIIEPLICRLSAEYDIDMPEAFASSLLASEREKLHLTEENLQLQQINQRLEQNLEQANEALLKCPVTKLNNESVFKEYLRAELQTIRYQKIDGAVLLIAVDDMAKLNLTYGVERGDEILKSVAYVLEELKQTNHSLFKVGGPIFGYYIAGSTKNEALKFAEHILTVIDKSEETISHITVSIGFVSLDELYDQGMHRSDDAAGGLLSTARLRLISAQRQGTNSICYEMPEGIDKLTLLGTILIVDTDQLNLDVLKTTFSQMPYRILTATDGDTALTIINEESPDVVICEAMIPQLDAFALREKTRLSSTGKPDLFILMSHLKDEESVRRAMSVEINHYFKKPYFLSEMVGIVNNHFHHR